MRARASIRRWSRVTPSARCSTAFSPRPYQRIASEYFPMSSRSEPSLWMSSISAIESFGRRGRAAPYAFAASSKRPASWRQSPSASQTRATSSGVILPERSSAKTIATGRGAPSIFSTLNEAIGRSAPSS